VCGSGAAPVERNPIPVGLLKCAWTSLGPLVGLSWQRWRHALHICSAR